MGGEDGCKERLRPSPGLICEIVDSVGQGNYIFVRKKSDKVREFYYDFFSIVL